MKENLFTVDLGKLKLTESQRASINASIQKAVASEIASFNLKQKIALLPINKFPKGPIINGIIIRDVDILQLDKIYR